MTYPPKYSIRGILTDNKNWERYKSSHSELDSNVIREVERMLDCCNPDKGYFRGYCEHCRKEVIMHFRCNGRICNRCGRSYVDKWMDEGQKFLDKDHRFERHSTSYIPYVMKTWGKEGVLEFLQHIIEDYQDTLSKYNGKCEIYGKDTWKGKKLCLKCYKKSRENLKY